MVERLNEIHAMDVCKRVAGPSTPEDQQAATPLWTTLAEEMKAAGAWISSSGLSPVSTATTVRVREGKRLITDGPFAETHEQLGGYFLLECQDLDEALRWAEKIPPIVVTEIACLST